MLESRAGVGADRVVLAQLSQDVQSISVVFVISQPVVLLVQNTPCDELRLLQTGATYARGLYKQPPLRAPVVPQK